jgi:arginine decarboxylase
VNPALVQRFGESVFRYDLSETPLTDDLHQPTGPIAAAQKLAAEAFGADHSYFLVNGTTCGVEAMVMAAARAGETILIARNAHKSALMGTILSGARPVWLTPETLEPWGLSACVTPETVERGFHDYPEAKAVLLVSPTYNGLCSDLAAIAEICHRHHALLLVDEAHGAHLYFSDELPAGALAQGADLCAQSIHKAAGAFTQSSMLHVRAGRVDLARVTSALHLVQSTSPSYLLMASLDAARQELALHGQESAAAALSLARAGRRALREMPGVQTLEPDVVGQAGIAALDETRLTFTACDHGLTGLQLQERLFATGVDTELADHRNVMALLTGGNTERDVTRLCEAMRQIAALPTGTIPQALPLPEPPMQVETPQQAYFGASQAVPLTASAGKIAAEMLVPYPPGIPILCPGEQVTEEIVRYAQLCRRDGVELHGPADQTLQTIRVTE